MSAQHYENFPVASWLCPPALRPAVSALYAYARTADDLADEGDATPARRLADLAAYREDLDSMWAGRALSPRWAPVFEALGSARRRHDLPFEPLADLLSAFGQDVTQHRYADRATLLDYCRRSANPVGRLLLHLYGITDATSLRHSDAVCTALQLTNFWQDLGIDLPRGRLYVPLADCERHGVATDALLAATEPGPPIAALVAELVGWTRELMHAGAPLAGRIGGRAGWELRFVVQGGLRILDKIERDGCDPRRSRPKLHWHDFPRLAWDAWRMPVAANWPQTRCA